MREAWSQSRRQFLKSTGVVTASALAGVTVPSVHAGGSDTIQVALVGCGGRGSGAAENALSTKSGPVKLVAMADVFPNRLADSHAALKNSFAAQMDVPEDRRFIGFDAYQKAIDCLNKGDVVILTTPVAFRWPHFRYAIEKGVNVFMEKPVTVDGPTTRKIIALGEEAAKKNLKVGVGLMCRHCKAREELYGRIKNGEIGDLLNIRAYRLVGPAGFTGPKPKDMSELLYQVQRFHSFMWASGGVFMDFLIHNIDESCWMKDAWPVKAQGSGGRAPRGGEVDQNFDHYNIEYTFADGTKLNCYARNAPNSHEEFASYAHGTRGSAVISTHVHTPAKCRIYKGHNQVRENLTWAFPQPEPNPYQLEWDDLMAAIRQDKPYNEARRGAEASLVTAMGRKACHTGKIVTFEEMLNDSHEFAPGVDKFTMSSPAPLALGPDGKYPIARMGMTPQGREF